MSGGRTEPLTSDIQPLDVRLHLTQHEHLLEERRLRVLGQMIMHLLRPLRERVPLFLYPLRLVVVGQGPDRRVE